MRRHAARLATLLVSVALLVLPSTPARAAENPNYVSDASPWGSCSVTYGYYNCDGMPDQAYLDKSNAQLGSNSQPGNWYDLAGPLTQRPYVQRLSIWNGATESIIVSDGAAPDGVTPVPSLAAGRLGVVLAPANLCDADRTPSPQTSGCYSTPNRISATLVYGKSDGQVGHNFTAPNDGTASAGHGITIRDNSGNPLVVDENTVIDLTVSLNSIGKSLRWTWLNGAPSYWSTADLGLDTASFHVKAKLAMKPQIDSNETYDTHLCTAVPVSSCEITRSNSDWLEFAMVLSLDTTMSEAMTGALFATEGAIIGSVEVAADSTTGLPQLQYALASSHYTHAGTSESDVRHGTLHAVIPASALVQQLGVPSFADTSALPDATTPSQIFTIARQGSCPAGCSAGTTSFTEWTAGIQGTDGMLVDVEGITFSAPKYRVKAASGALKKPSASRSGSKYSIKVNSGTSTSSLANVNGVCKAQGCTVKLFKASATKTSGALTYVASHTVAKRSNIAFSFSVTRKTTGAVSGRVQSGTRYLVVVTRRDTGAVISSAPVVLP